MYEWEGKMGCIGLVGSFVIIKPMNIFYFNQSEVSILPNLGGGVG